MISRMRVGIAPSCNCEIELERVVDCSLPDLV